MKTLIVSDLDNTLIDFSSYARPHLPFFKRLLYPVLSRNYHIFGHEEVKKGLKETLWEDLPGLGLLKKAQEETGALVLIATSREEFHEETRIWVKEKSQEVGVRIESIEFVSHVQKVELVRELARDHKVVFIDDHPGTLRSVKEIDEVSLFKPVYPYNTHAPAVSLFHSGCRYTPVSVSLFLERLRKL